jgi:ATP-dependent helicase/nuclease subunit A
MNRRRRLTRWSSSRSTHATTPTATLRAGSWPMSAHIRFISAGAGSGKTYRLTELLLAELQAGRVRPAGVLATTFTKRAATELRERVRGFLISQGEFTRADAVGSARIGTVNSVCGSLLQRFAFEAGLPTEQRVLDEARAGQLLREAVDTVIEGHALSELLQVARRLSLDADPRGGKPPWQDALGKLVDQARANAIDADVLRVSARPTPTTCSRTFRRLPRWISMHGWPPRWRRRFRA